MKILGIEHVGIAAESLETIAPFWGEVLGIAHYTTETVESEGVIADTYDTGRGKIELLTEFGDESPISKFLRKRGPGIHHICLEVQDIQEAVDELREKGIELINEVPRVGADGCRVVFVHPRGAGGVLLELVEKAG